MNQRQQVAGGGEFSDFGGRRTGNDENGNFCTGQFAQRFHGAGNKRSVQEFLSAEDRVAKSSSSAAEASRWKKWRM